MPLFFLPGWRMVLCAVACLSLAPAAHGQRPNIILMVADNLGRESVGYYGQRTFDTPRLDRMAAEGVVFENCLIATPLCSPARCALNTGRHPFRVGLNSQPVPGDPHSGLSLTEISLARILSEAGYHTALFGKWNLGYALKFNPIHHGFDEFYGSNAGHADYYTHLYNRDMQSHFYRDLTPIEEEGYFDTLFTNAAIHFLRSRTGNPQPFYLNLAFYAPHGPYQAPPGYYHSDNPDTNYRYMVEYLDLCVGRVLDEVDRLGVAENTLIVFLSDQGGSRVNDYGRTLRERGLKVICNALWQGKIAPGTRVGTPWVHFDLYPTFAALAGAQVPADRVIDGQNVWPMFEGRETAPPRTFHWTYRNEDAVRIGDWKLHQTDAAVDGLFNLAQDPDEQHDQSARHPDRIAKLLALHARWKHECKAQQTSVARSPEPDVP